MERERDIEKYLKARVEEMGGLFMKFVSPGNDGVPDRIAIMPGDHVWFVELKTSKGRTTAIQEWQIEQIKKRDVPAIVVRGMTDARVFIETLRDEQDGLI